MTTTMDNGLTICHRSPRNQCNPRTIRVSPELADEHLAGHRFDSLGECPACDVEIDGATITILRSGEPGTVITWTVAATDACGNQSTEQCSVEVVAPPIDDDDDDDDDDG